MYKNLEAELKRKSLTRANVAETLGINISTLSDKLTKPGRLKLEEALKIKRSFFPELSIDYLFDETVGA